VIAGDLPLELDEVHAAMLDGFEDAVTSGSVVHPSWFSMSRRNCWMRTAVVSAFSRCRPESELRVSW
jgi:phage terminase large subunit-like protein